MHQIAPETVAAELLRTCGMIFGAGKPDSPIGGTRNKSCAVFSSTLHQTAPVGVRDSLAAALHCEAWRSVENFARTSAGVRVQESERRKSVCCWSGPEDASSLVNLLQVAYV